MTTDHAGAARFDPAQDLAVLRAMAAELKDYLLSSVLYWRMQAPGTFPLLTLGGYLLRLHRLDALATRLGGSDREALAAAHRAYDEIIGEWRVRAADRLKQELRSRLGLLGQYVDELDFSRDEIQPGHWPHEAETRVLIELLLDAARRLTDVAELESLARTLDTRLQRHLVPGEFIADPALEPAYPRDRFWWMYSRPGPK